MPAAEGGCASALRAFAITFPPLKIALYINDIICYLFGKLIDLIRFTIGLLVRFTWYLFELTFSLVKRACSYLLERLLSIQFIRKLVKSRPYTQLRLNDTGRPLPHANDLIKRLFTYHGGMLLALALYSFIYFVLIERHTYTSVSLATVLLLVYLILIENSHTFRSILMLSLPIMFTNRGRALVYCSMLAIMANGPIRTLKFNVKEIHSSLTCCKQYLIVSSDRQIEENYVKGLVKVEEVVLELVANIKEYGKALKEEFAEIIRLAIACEQYIIDAVDFLKNIVNICNTHTDDVYRNCAEKISAVQYQCRQLFDPFRFSLCDLVGNTNTICSSVKLPSRVCQLPVEVINYIERTLGAKLRQYIRVIENEFYVDIDIQRNYSYNLIKSKSYSKVAHEIKFDVEQKFWYVHIIGRLFHFITLALVIFILATAAFYHMHYQGELSYDNMYLDDSLLEIDARRQQGRAGTMHNGQDDRQRQKRELPEQQNLNLISIDDELDESLSATTANDPSGLAHEDPALDGAGPSSSPADKDDDDQRSIIDQFDPLSDANNPSEPVPEKDQSNEDSVSMVSNDNQTIVDHLGLIAEQELGLDGPRKVDRQDSKTETSVHIKGASLFPLTDRHERHYLRPTSLAMNHTERSKLKWSSVVWLIITGYIWFFVLIDFAFYWLVSFLVDILRKILFTDDLPLVDLETQSRTSNGSDPIVRYNRTYLNTIRRQQMDRLKGVQVEGTAAGTGHDFNSSLGHSNSSIKQFYRRLMDSIERDIPDDVAILGSLEECLPKVHVPGYGTYRTLIYLAIFTFFAVLVEAYALRTRHCIANLYYPDRAQARSIWLYKKIFAEKAKFEDEPDEKVVLEWDREKGLKQAASRAADSGHR